MSLTPFQKARFRSHLHRADDVRDGDTGDPISAAGAFRKFTLTPDDWNEDPAGTGDPGLLIPMEWQEDDILGRLYVYMEEEFNFDYDFSGFSYYGSPYFNVQVDVGQQMVTQLLNAQDGLPSRGQPPQAFDIHTWLTNGRGEGGENSGVWVQPTTWLWVGTPDPLSAPLSGIAHVWIEVIRS